MKEENYIKLDEEVKLSDEEYFPSKLSANALFNFMKEYDYLERAINKMAFSPRYYSENVEYLQLKYNGTRLKEWFIPMTCFCDIPLHQISMHAEGIDGGGYGKFGIALHKKFGIDKGIQPIQYLNSNSVYTKELTKAINTLLSEKPNLGDEIYFSMSEHLFEQIRLIKPFSGPMKKKIDGRENYGEIKKNFHDEHEWRYLPKIEIDEAPLMLVDRDDILLEISKNYYTESIEKTKEGLLHFKESDIKYIFVDSELNRDRLIRFIRSKTSGKRLLKSEKDILISKIMVYDDLKEDW